jgi:hypothetical protein
MYSHLQILGPYNSGSNLINNLLKNKLITDIPDGDTHIWKHTINKDDLEETINKNKNTIFIACYRPIYSWIKSTEKNQYKLKWDRQLDSNVEFFENHFLNISALYDHYYNMYAYFIEKYDNVISLEYFKICDTTISYDYIQSKLAPFNIQLTDKDNYFDVLNKKSKIHGHSVNNSNEAILAKQELDKTICPKEIIINQNIVKFYENL